METTMEHYLTEYHMHKGLLAGNGQDWLDRMREQAISGFVNSGFPTRRNEEWKYTDLTEMGAQSFKPVINGDPAVLKADVQKRSGSGEHIRVFFENGCWLSEETGSDLPPPGATITSLGKMLTDFPDRIKEHLALFPDLSRHELMPVNTAFSADGAFVQVGAGIQLQRPLELLFHATQHSTPHLSVPRNLIILEEGARATILENHVSQHESLKYWTNSHTAIILGPGAFLEHVQLQQESDAAYHTSVVQVRQYRDSRYVSHVYSLGGRLSRSDLDVYLEAGGSGCELNGLYLAAGSQHMDHHTRIDHLKPDSSSTELYKGILAGNSHAVFNGKIFVHPEAQRISALQSNANLLLSRQAEIDTKPQLEIFADDVKCSHGATVGQLDDDALFFLKSRGIDGQAARSMLLNAFTEEIVNRIASESVRSTVLKAVSEKVRQLTLAGGTTDDLS